MPTLTLTDQVAAAQAAAQEPRQRVSALSSALSEAIASEQFDRAAQFKPELESARGELIVAEAAVAALHAGAATAEQERQATERKIAEAQRRARAADDLNEATAAEQHGLSELGAALDRMFEHLVDAQRELRAAIAREHSVGEARRRAAIARDQASESPTGMLPTVAQPNKASVLAEQDPLLACLIRWSR